MAQLEFPRIHHHQQIYHGLFLVESFLTVGVNSHRQESLNILRIKYIFFIVLVYKSSATNVVNPIHGP